MRNRTDVTFQPFATFLSFVSLLVTDDLIDMISKTGLPYIVRCDHPAIPIRLNLGQTQTGPGVRAKDCS